jgi:hypothetical protein
MSLHSGDKPAAFIGLVGGLVLIVVMVGSIVAWTSSKFEGHTPGAPAAGAPATH